MRIQQFKNEFFSHLDSLFPTTEIQSFFNILIEFRLKMPRVKVALEPNFEISVEDLNYLQQALLKLKKQVPIQYIIGETEFYGLTFKVNKNVLIPRPETEELVNWVLNNVKPQTPNSKLSILDIGTGSGCIAIALAKSLPNSAVYAIDVSKEALKLAKENAHKNNVLLHLIEADILNLIELPRSFDIIISNPPYVRFLEQEQMQQNVLNYEPHLALFVNDSDPLVFYHKIADLAKKHLNLNGSLYFEINQYLGKETTELLASKNFKIIELKKDLFGADRMLKAKI